MKKEEVLKFLHRKNYTKMFLARELGMTRQGLEYHLKGDGNVKQFIADKIREITGYDSGWEDEEEALGAKGHFYPLLDVQKIEASSIPHLITHTAHNQFFQYSKKEFCFCVIASGDSMQAQSNRSILEGDILFIDMEHQLMNGDIVFVMFKNGRKFVRVYMTNDDSFTFKPLNPSYPEIMVKKEDVEFVYRVLYARSRDREL
ncbi:MAG TPA: S24 family peptidase [Ignavibacteriales bacterium]|nr:S24 family peptidase [Ignavibacteriales bacterium]